MIWVRANRGRLVAACLTVCRAWIAAGRPRGQRSIGSYESWAQTMGGVLQVAGVEGFLGNLDEMMEASDGEGAVWRSFVSAWWDRFGTAEVGTGDLFALATDCEPPLPMGSGGERSQRTSLGMALGKMRDRMFDIGGRKARVRMLGVSHQAKRWQLNIEGEPGEPFSRPFEAQVGEPFGGEGNLWKKGSPGQPIENKASGEPGEPGEPFLTLTREETSSHILRDSQKGSPGSPSPDNSTGYVGEPLGEPLPAPAQGSPIPNPPAWLDGVP